MYRLIPVVLVMAAAFIVPAAAVADETEPVNESQVIADYIGETYALDWGALERSDWLTVEATLVGYSEDATTFLCQDYARRGAAFFRLLQGDEVDMSGAWAVYESLDSSRSACYWAQQG
jgi:hypothetical protein